jgi:hypothetical protein
MVFIKYGYHLIELATRFDDTVCWAEAHISTSGGVKASFSGRSVAFGLGLDSFRASSKHVLDQARCFLDALNKPCACCGDVFKGKGDACQLCIENYATDTEKY